LPASLFVISDSQKQHQARQQVRCGVVVVWLWCGCGVVVVVLWCRGCGVAALIPVFGSFGSKTDVIFFFLFLKLFGVLGFR
jgi:hypothetical protein